MPTLADRIQQHGCDLPQSHRHNGHYFPPARSLLQARPRKHTECSRRDRTAKWSHRSRIFFSVHNLGIAGDGCTGSAGCLYSVQVPTATPFTFPTTATGVPEAGGTSGIVIDNVAAGGQDSNIYFSTLANGACATTNGCAVKLTQAALQ